MWGNKKIIYFLCTGNSCRSQMAEGITDLAGAGSKPPTSQKPLRTTPIYWMDEPSSSRIEIERKNSSGTGGRPLPGYKEDEDEFSSL
ncbi:hypothetical protein [Brevibacillus agri]|uniref:arsenate reductase/protein-tyrosine-phosphatase family protein n=1 Tax=Brevibacillus agri TaxID=51101 RepID=UPI0030842796